MGRPGNRAFSGGSYEILARRFGSAIKNPQKWGEPVETEAQGDGGNFGSWIREKLCTR